MLAVSPSSATAQASAVDSAFRLIQKLNSLSANVQNLRKQTDEVITANVDKINGLLEPITTLNDKIVRDLATECGAADLMDQRDLALHQLSELLDIQVFTRRNRGHGGVHHQRHHPLPQCGNGDQPLAEQGQRFFRWHRDRRRGYHERDPVGAAQGHNQPAR